MAAGRKTANVHGCKPNHRRIEQIGPVGSLTAGLLGQAGVIFRVPPSPAFRYTSRAIWKGDRVHFGNSQLLWLTAFIVPLLGLFFWWAWRRRARLLTQFIHSKLIDQLTLGLSHGRRLAKLGLLLFITTLLMLALARPKLDYEWQETEMRSLDILVGVDTYEACWPRIKVPTDRAGQARRARPDALGQARPAWPDRLLRYRLFAVPADYRPQRLRAKRQFTSARTSSPREAPRLAKRSTKPSARLKRRRTTTRCSC